MSSQMVFALDFDFFVYAFNGLLQSITVYHISCKLVHINLIQLLLF